MSIRSIPSCGIAPVIAGVLIPVFSAQLTWAQCSYTVLEPNKVTTTTTAPEYFSIEQPTGTWTAIALQSASGEDWDLFMNGTTAPYPGCVDGPLAASIEGPGLVEFIVGDFTHGAPGTFYPLAKQYSGSGDAEIVHAKTSKILEVNGIIAIVDQGDRVSLDCWGVYLEAGHTYSIHFENHPLSGLDPKLFLFRNPGGERYWASRAQADLEITGPTTYVAPASDWYCLVGVSDNYGSGTYFLSIGECSDPIVLSSGRAEPVDLRTTYFEINQIAQSWAAVGFQYDEQGIGLWMYGDTDTGIYPHCFGDSLIHDDKPESRIALVAGNFSPGGLPTGTYHGRAEHRYYASSGLIEWESATGAMPINGTPVTRQMGPDSLLDCYEIQLDETETYSFQFSPVGDAAIELRLFRDPGTPTWTRSAIAGFHGSQQYSPPSTGKYGLVAVNQNGERGAYSLSVNQCLPLPTRLTESVRVHTAVDPLERYSFVQQRGGWAAIAVKGMADWDLFVFEHASGGDPDFCFSGPLAASSSAPAGGVDFVIGDFHRNPAAEYYASAELESGGGEATVVWKPYSIPIYVNGLTHGSAVAGNDFIHLYEVFLAAGVTYQFNLTHEYGSGIPKLILFAPDGDSYWADRAFHEFETLSGVLYMPISSGFFGMAVVNDSVDPAGYSVSVTSAGVSAEGVTASSKAVIRSLIPNPTDGALTIQFETAKPGPVSFEIVNVAGRRIARIDNRPADAGIWEANWNGRTPRGESAPAGVYFVRIYDGDHVSAARKFVISH